MIINSILSIAVSIWRAWVMQKIERLIRRNDTVIAKRYAELQFAKIEKWAKNLRMAGGEQRAKQSAAADG